MSRVFLFWSKKSVQSIEILSRADRNWEGVLMIFFGMGEKGFLWDFFKLFKFFSKLDVVNTRAYIGMLSSLFFFISLSSATISNEDFIALRYLS